MQTSLQTKVATTKAREAKGHMNDGGYNHTVVRILAFLYQVSSGFSPLLVSVSSI